jgi:diguanylate cyclase (GGDEF)-like protein/PAS domain S-box-containing protein
MTEKRTAPEKKHALEQQASSFTDAVEEIARKLQKPLQPDLEDDFIRYALDSAAIVAHTDVRGTITYVNRKFCEISGYTARELIGANHRILHSGIHNKDFFRDMYRDIAHGKIWHGEICNRRKDGSRYWVDTTIVPHLSPAGKVDSYTAIRFDISARKELESALRTSKEHLDQLANLDPLTGLPNRRRFQEFLEMQVQDHERSNDIFHLALLDVDSFKEVNDTFGHHAGDVLLQNIGKRLHSFEDSQLFMSRMGGDEFSLILVGATDDEADMLFEEILEAIRQPMVIGSTPRRISSSLGIARFPRDGKDVGNLFKAADLALYKAKALGRDRVEVFQPQLREVARRKSALYEEIEGGLEHGEFELHYQPIIPLISGQAFSLEALMRWRHPERGLLTPAYFGEGFEDRCSIAAQG